eukprot:scaffold2534_cov260-Pinguiococcus_pyrenoidosus.AAC.32
MDADDADDSNGMDDDEPRRRDADDELEQMDEDGGGGDSSAAAPQKPKYRIVNGIRVRGRGVHQFRPRPLHGRDAFRDDDADGDR